MSLTGTRVFVVEDEALILMVLEDLLAAMGCEIVASALRLEDALAKASSLDFDVAVLDVNLGGQPVEPVADMLAGRGIPFLFASGYGVPSLPQRHAGRQLLAKPYAAAELAAALREVLAAHVDAGER
jgi:CheY-like chemotaxis protein